ncbi:glycosyltransferase [Robertkochia marina]|uniref:Glycosyltransferase n=1 Tax=Robertkochia marina TaxID=1227945 RepID=A0A4S3LZN8_9FLAO|nr:glycosyltransferase [Robertkochia marina]THD66775.1 glycosyltransferase [Robertkochia marina]TRZ41934.1 glycosyltransferase [Robertkochia marina]
MKIVHVINSLDIGGAERLLIDTLQELKRKGIDVTLILLCNRESLFLKKLRDSGFDNIIFLTKGSIYNPKLIFKLVKILGKFDIVHAHLFPSQYFVVIAKIIGNLSIKIIITEHSTKNKRTENKILAQIDKWIYTHYDNIICITNEVYKGLTQHLRNSNNLKLIYNGINLLAFQTAVKYNYSDLLSFGITISEDNILLIQISAFREPKDHLTLLKVMRELPKKYILLLVGDGKTKKEYKDLATKMNLNQQVYFLGNRNDVPKLLKTAHISILSTDWEGFGLVAIESMAAGIPFIGTRVGGLIELLRDAGETFEKKDHAELKNIIVEISNSNVTRNNMIQSGLKKSKNYDLSLMVDKYIALYFETMNTYETILPK